MSERPFLLTLADGTRLALHATDGEAAATLAFFARAARLPCANGNAGSAPGNGEVLHLRFRTAPPASRGDGEAYTLNSPAPTLPAGPDSPTDVQLAKRRRFAARQQPSTPEQRLWQQLVRLSAHLARQTHARGGFLVHGALALAPIPSAFSPSSGILLAGRSGVGKSTASRRLPSPWRALSDDVTLIVRDAAGTYWAHPWPTWSRFFGEERGDGNDSWDLQSAVPLAALFVLEQDEHDRGEPLGPGHTAALLAELSRQTAVHYLKGMPLDEIATFNVQRFENICTLVKTLPAYHLDLSLHGHFWDEIARCLHPSP